MDKSKTIDLLKKYWILLLGFLLFFASLLYFIKIGYDDGWVSPLAILITGIAADVVFFAAGFILYRKEFKIIGEILAGFACGVTYATIAYANFSSLWPDIVTFIIIIGITIVISIINFRFNLRILTALGFAAALFAPLIVRAPAVQVNVLFIYVCLIDAAMILFCIVKKWKELSFIGLILTSLLYIGYYLVIRPSGWIEPFVYVSVIFVLYAAGILFMAKQEGDSFHPPLLVLYIVNIVCFGFWSLYIFKVFSLASSVPVTVLGILLLLSAMFVSMFLKKSSVAAVVFFCTGIVLLAVTGVFLSELADIWGMEHVIRGTVWLLLIAILFITGYRIKNIPLVTAGLAGWFFILLYWFINAWGIDEAKWFGLDYTPFINPPGLLWMGVIAAGFFMSILTGKIAGEKVEEKKRKGYVYAVRVMTFLSHIAVGGLLTLEVYYLWVYYTMPFDAAIVYSVIWGLYAFILFLWGFLRKDKLFIYFADVVLVIVVGKILIFDIAGKSSIFVAATILITSLLIIATGFLNYKRQTILAFRARKKEEAAGEKKEYISTEA
ncbi:MAG: DUF2339 domain-containing protein [Spirochaetales bacterium]|nr:DUF2339 domain-containing protein [Spirochaetales bacterium]